MSTGDRQAFRMFLDMVEGILVARLGDEAKFTKAERDLIEPNAAKMLTSMSPKAAENIGKFATPIGLASGIFMYFMRVSAMQARKRDSGPPIPRPPGAETPPATRFTPATPEPNPAARPAGNANVRAGATNGSRAGNSVPAQPASGVENPADPEGLLGLAPVSLSSDWRVSNG